MPRVTNAVARRRPLEGDLLRLFEADEDHRLAREVRPVAHLPHHPQRVRSDRDGFPLVDADPLVHHGLGARQSARSPPPDGVAELADRVADDVDVDSSPPGTSATPLNSTVVRLAKTPAMLPASDAGIVD